MKALIGTHEEAYKFAKFHNLKQGEYKAVSRERDIAGFKVDSYVLLYSIRQINWKEFSTILDYCHSHRIPENTELK